MATKTEEFLTGTGTTIQFTTQYINESDIKVRVDGGSPLTFIGTTGTPSTGQYKIAANSTTITFGDNQNGKSLHIYSETSVNNPTVTFFPGSSIKAGDLNKIETLIRHGIQESRNEIVTHDIRDAQITSVKIKDGTIVGDDISDSAAIPFAKLATGLLPSGITVNSNNIVNGSIKAEDLETGTLDGRYFTETESDARYFRQDSTETISSGDTWSSADSHIATTGAINARIIDLIEEVGGFVPLANETSFPDANPDINNGNGTIVSIQAASTDLVPTGGAVTIANGRGTGKPVIITGVTATIPKDFGVLLETTSTDHTYAFHRLTAIATEVHTVASNITTIQAVNTNQPNINAVVANQTNIDKVVGNESNINLVSGELAPFTTDLGFITNTVNTTAAGNDINTVADNIQDVKDVANTIESGGLFQVDSLNKTAGSVVYYDGTQFKADTTTTKNTLVTGGNF